MKGVLKMKKLKMFVNTKDLNEYERENNRISYKRLVNRLFTDMILCNDITKLFGAWVDHKCWCENIEVGDGYDKENDCFIDIFQYFIVDFNSYTYEHILQKYAKQLGEEFILYYIEELDLYILGVTHFGTGWDYVLTDIIPTDDLDSADL